MLLFYFRILNEKKTVNYFVWLVKYSCLELEEQSLRISFTVLESLKV